MSVSEDSNFLATIATGLISTVGGGLIGWLTGRRKTNAEADATTQAQIDKTIKFLLDEVRAERQSCEEKLLNAEGRISGLQQELWSLESRLREHGIPLPKRPAPAAIVFAPKPEEN